MSVGTCPACGTSQQTHEGVAGFKCQACQRDVWRIACRRCHNACTLYGPVTGSGQIAFRCGKCRARNFVSTVQLRSIKAEVRRATQIAAAAKRQYALSEKEVRAAHLAAREDDVAERNVALQGHVEELEGLLTASLKNAPYSFDFMRVNPELPTFAPGALANVEPLPDRDTFLPPALTAVKGLLPGAKKHQAALISQAEEIYQQAVRDHQAREAERTRRLALAEVEHKTKVDETKWQAEQSNAQIDDLERRYTNADPDAVSSFFADVVGSAYLPDSFPKDHRVAFSPASKQLVVELELPSLAAMPEIREYRYIKTKDEINSVALPAAQRRAMYTSVIAQLTLRTISEVIRSDAASIVESVVVNGHVRSIDTRTGNEIHPCIVTVRTTRDQLGNINLAQVDPADCLKGLNASLSRSPSELVPVRPILEFDMVDPRFIKETDVLSTLDTRPNLMELSPKDFESLITNLFEKMGLETRLTQPSRDGGVDCVAYDPRPIFGGKVVIQAKRYKNTVGVSAVRDLFGTMQNEGASKGILVTTSGYGQASHEFASGKPLELLDGANLLYLLKEHAEIDAKIEPPDDWVDPVLDS